MNNKKVKQLALIGVIITFVGFFLWGVKADAAELRLGFATGYQANAGAAYQELMVTSSDRHWYAAVTRIGGDDEHNYKYNRWTAGYRVNWRRDKRISPFMRLGVAYFTEPPTDYISDEYAFDLAIGFRFFNVVELELDQHNSTGGRSDENEGLDAVMLSMVLPF
jgi:hypothetical protein